MADYQIVAGDDGSVILVDSSQGQSVVRLPAPASAFKVTIKDIGGMASVYKINVLRNAGEMIDNALSDSIIDENNADVTFVSDGTNWTRMDGLHRNQIATTGRGVMAGGETSTLGAGSTTIDYVSIATASTSSAFGTLTSGRSRGASNSSSVRAVFSGGQSSATASSASDYVTMSTLGNGVSFGNMTSARFNIGAVSTQSRAILAGGENSGGTSLSTIEYFSVQVSALALSFGTLAVVRDNLSGGCGIASPVRGVFPGGFNGSSDVQSIEYITIASLGNGTNFGNLSTNKRNCGQASNSVRGLVSGGTAGATLIEYVTIATASNAANFGNLDTSRDSEAGLSSLLRASFVGGNTNSTVIQSVLISTLSNSASFGALATGRSFMHASSSCHGGLSGF